jgi:hypothetical protein
VSGLILRIGEVSSGVTGRSSIFVPMHSIAFANYFRGCVTGKVIENIRGSIEDPAKPGNYRWDILDGYDGDEKNSLQDSPKLQEKVRRVVTQGFIDPEDWNGVRLKLT